MMQFERRELTDEEQAEWNRTELTPEEKRIAARERPHCTYCGSFVKPGYYRNHYNGTFDLCTWIYWCKRCEGEMRVELV